MKYSLKGLIVVISVLSISSTNFIAQEEAHKNNLKLVMQGLLKDSQNLSEGIFYEDYLKIEQAANKIAYHPKPGQPTIKKVIGHLGKEMPVFKGLDTKVHNIAVSIAEAASDKNMPSVIASYHELIDGCQSCHSQFKSRVSKILQEP